MQVSIQGARPPFCRFEVRAVEDRTASLEKKCYQTKDVIFALITPSGSKDVVEKVADEWFEQMEQFVREERFDPRWLEYYKSQFRAFKDGQAPVVDGTSIKLWKTLSPSQMTNLQSLGFRTVEDVAQANEEGISRMGIGGRQLRDQARQLLEEQKSDDQLREQLAKQQAELEELKKLLAEQAKAAGQKKATETKKL